MSVLTSDPEPEAHKRARQVIEQAQKTKLQLMLQLNRSMAIVWTAPDPQSVFDALGTDAAAVVELTEGLIAYLTATLTAANDTEGLAYLDEVVQMRLPYTKNGDGTVTIDQ